MEKAAQALQRVAEAYCVHSAMGVAGAQAFEERK